MAVIVETGAIVAGANAYISAADADSYHADRGITLWATLSTNEKEQAIIRAADYMERQYASRFKGERVSSAQTMSWPRVGAVVYGISVASNTVPQQVAAANAEMAFIAASGALYSVVESQTVESVTVGPISRKLSAPRNGGQRRFAVVDSLLRDLVRGGGASIELIRA